MIMEDEELMTNRLLPPDYQQELFRQFQDYRQGTKIVNEYMEELDRLVNHSDLEVLSLKKKNSDFLDTEDQ